MSTPPRDRVYVASSRRERPAAARRRRLERRHRCARPQRHRHQRMDGLLLLQCARRFRADRSRERRRELSRGAARRRKRRCAAAIEVGWQGDHYALDFADDGSSIAMHNAMTTGWAAYSGATDYHRAVAALEGGLEGIERPDRILLLQTPFFEHSRPYPGRIADYPPGVRENARPIQPRRVLDRRRVFARRAARRARGATGKPRESSPPAPSRSTRKSRR